MRDLAKAEYVSGDISRIILDQVLNTSEIMSVDYIMMESRAINLRLGILKCSALFNLQKDTTITTRAHAATSVLTNQLSTIFFLRGIANSHLDFLANAHWQRMLQLKKANTIKNKEHAIRAVSLSSKYNNKLSEINIIDILEGFNFREVPDSVRYIADICTGNSAKRIKKMAAGTIDTIDEYLISKEIWATYDPGSVAYNIRRKIGLQIGTDKFDEEYLRNFLFFCIEVQLYNEIREVLSLILRLEQMTSTSIRIRIKNILINTRLRLAGIDHVAIAESSMPKWLAEEIEIFDSALHRLNS